MSVMLVSAYAGDRKMTEAEEALIQQQRRSRGTAFFSDLLFAICHQYFAPEIAEVLWAKVLAHKLLISTRLDRNVRIAVATLDFLSNVTSELSAFTLISESYVSQIANLSMRDGMTGLFNHASCHELLALEFRYHQRYRQGVALMLLDIDDFKAINDQHGHQEGDRVLIAMARTLVQEARDSDICCRLGGDEFVVILRQTRDPVEVCQTAERIRARISGSSFARGPLAVSVGVALCDRLASSPRALLERADQALYQAKAGSKNRVVLGLPVQMTPVLEGPPDMRGIGQATPPTPRRSPRRPPGRRPPWPSSRRGRR